MKLSAVLGVGIVLAGCQDTVAPVADAGVSDFPSATAMSRSVGQERQLIKDQYIVVFREGTVDAEDRARGIVKRAGGTLKHTYHSGIKGFAGRMSAAAARELSKDPSVAYIEQDQLITLGVGKPSSGGGKGGKGRTRVDTATSGTQAGAPWGLDRVDQTELPLNGSYTFGASGSGVHAYIVDSGIRITHSEFSGRATGDFTIVDDGNGASDCNWHGTHVAGIVGGTTAGVAKAVRLHAVRVLDCNGSGSVSGLIAGLDWVAANRQLPAVANVSVLTAQSTALNEAVDRLVSTGVTVVVAAGNNSDDACNYSPASAASALSVGATTSSDGPAAFSNHGECIDLLAPGVDIMSSFYSSDSGLMPASGTSMAAPHVSGAAAVYLQNNPTAVPSTVVGALLGSGTSGRLTGLVPGTPNLLVRVP